MKQGNILRITYSKDETENAINFLLDDKAIGGLYGKHIADEIVEHIETLKKYYSWNKIELETGVIDYCKQSEVNIEEKLNDIL